MLRQQYPDVSGSVNNNQNYFKLTINQRACLDVFYEFTCEKYVDYCAACMILLYPEECRWIHSRQFSLMPCTKWYMSPIVDRNAGACLVCVKHKSGDAIKTAMIMMVSSGGESDQELTCREKGALSPIKIMANITRPQSTAGAYTGFYQLSSRALYIIHCAQPRVCTNGTVLRDLGSEFGKGNKHD